MSGRKIISLLLVALLSVGVAGTTFAAVPQATGPGFAAMSWLGGLLQGGLAWLGALVVGNPGGGPGDGLGYDLEPGG